MAKEQVLKTLRIDKDVVEKIEKKAKKAKRTAHSLMVEGINEKANSK